MTALLTSRPARAGRPKKKAVTLVSGDGPRQTLSAARSATSPGPCLGAKDEGRNGRKQGWGARHHGVAGDGSGPTQGEVRHAHNTGSYNEAVPRFKLTIEYAGTRY